MPLVFALTLFLSATLLFLVQPMIAKMILPKFGGTPAVWNTCMVFFQAALLAGYGYAHAVPAWLGIRRQVLVHVGLLVLPFVVLPIAVSENYAPPSEAYPIPYVLALLLLTVGLPFFVVSTSAPLLQKWFANTGHPAAGDPYFLYAASNLGSMVALIGYPALVEPYLRLQSQGWLWTAGYAVLLAATAICAWLVYKTAPATLLAEAPATETSPTNGSAPSSEAANESDQPLPHEDTGAVRSKKRKAKRKQFADATAKTSRNAVTIKDRTAATSRTDGFVEEDRLDEVTPGRRLYWVALAFVPSSLMLGVTTYLTTDIAAIPLLWVIPLALYLCSFILVFSQSPRRVEMALLGSLIELAPAGQRPKWREAIAGGVGHKALILLMPVAILLLIFMILSKVQPAKITTVFELHLATLFLVAMVCHGELARDRPAARYLTEFYLWMSLGGVLGGMFNALLAPLVFTQISEYRLALVLACLVLPTLGAPEKGRWTRIMDIGLPAVLGMLAVGLVVKRWIDALGNLSKTEGEKYTFWTPVKSFLDQLRPLPDWESGWYLWLGLLGLAAAVAYIVFTRKERLDRIIDVETALALGVLSAAIMIRPPESAVEWYYKALERLPEKLGQMLVVSDERLMAIITFGLPALFCYIFVERPVRFALCVGAFLLAGTVDADLKTNTVLHRERSFFGAINVKVARTYDQIFNPRLMCDHTLTHGTTLHGEQHFYSDTEVFSAFALGLGSCNPLETASVDLVGQHMLDRRREALTYYHRRGPIGQVIDELERRGKPAIAVVGLGTGTLASYGQPGQTFTYYEIDPAVRRIAYNRDWFTYLGDALDRGVNLKVDMGDARLRLGRSQDPPYGLIAVDAFSSDAIPVHLITREALQLYMNKLADDGIVAFHISNRHLNLEPVLVNLAREDGLQVLELSDRKDDLLGKSASTWVFLARHMSAFGELAAKISRWPTDPYRRWKDLIRKPSADSLSDADLAQWKEDFLERDHKVRELYPVNADEVTRWKDDYGRREEAATIKDMAKWKEEFWKTKQKAREQGSLTEAELEQWKEKLAKMSDADLKQLIPRKVDSLKDETVKRTIREEKLAKMPAGEAKRLIQEEMDKHWKEDEALRQKVGIWTDDFSNLLSVFDWSD